MTVGFTRKTNLTNLVGRIDYISNEKRQENIVDFYDGLGKENAKKLAKFSQEEFKKSINFGKKDSHGNLYKCIEGRELITHFSHDLEGVITAEMVSKSIEETLNIKGVITALHWNKNHTNFHAHSIVPDRDILEEPIIVKAERNLFFDSQGKRVYKKALADPSKTIKKGDIIEERLFSNKREDIRSLDFSKKMKQWAIDFNNQYSNTKQRLYDKSIDGPAQVHEGNNPTIAEKRRKSNQALKIEKQAKNKPIEEVKKEVVDNKRYEDLLNRFSQKKQVQPTTIRQEEPIKANIEPKQEQPIETIKPIIKAEEKAIKEEKTTKPIQPKTEEKRVDRSKTEEKPIIKPIVKDIPKVEYAHAWVNPYEKPSLIDTQINDIRVNIRAKCKEYSNAYQDKKDIEDTINNRSTGQKFNSFIKKAGDVVGANKVGVDTVDYDQKYLNETITLMNKLKTEIKRLYSKLCSLLKIKPKQDIKLNEINQFAKSGIDEYHRKFNPYFEAEKEHKQKEMAKTNIDEFKEIKPITTSTKEQISLNRLNRLENEKKTKQ